MSKRRRSRRKPTSVKRAILLALRDLAVLVAVPVLLRGAWRWTRVPLGPREQLTWMRFLYEVVSGYGDGELAHVYEAAGVPYRPWGNAPQPWAKR